MVLKITGRVPVFAVAILLLLLLLAVAGVWGLQVWGESFSHVPAPRVINFPPHTSLAKLAQDLETVEVIDSALLFRLLVRYKHDFQKFQAGKYRFADAVTANGIATTITQGEVHRELKLQLTIPEGFTLTKIIARMGEKGIDDKATLTKLVQDRAFIKSLKIKALTLEGYLYPATYKFYDRAPTGREVLAAMVAKLQAIIPPDYRQKIASRGLSLHEAITMASLIELETAHDDERAKISEVIWLRLKDKIPLGIDAAIIYGIKDYRGDLRRSHLTDPKNPYNTRIHRDLPPGPIGSPSLASLLAIINPAQEGNYFYVLIPDGRKRHHFSKSLQEHNRHVQKLIRATRNK